MLSLLAAAAQTTFYTSCFRATFLFLLPVSNFWNEASKTLTSALNSLCTYYFFGRGCDGLNNRNYNKGRLFSQVVNPQHYVVACVCEIRFTSECTLKFHLLNSLIGVWLWVCVLFVFLLVCVIVPSYFRLDSRNLYEENERKMKACSFFYWLLEGNVLWLRNEGNERLV